MAPRPYTPGFCPGQSLSEQADQAFEAFAAMRRTAQAEPWLIENEYFTALQDTARARFLAVWEAL